MARVEKSYGRHVHPSLCVDGSPHGERSPRGIAAGGPSRGRRGLRTLRRP
ncbi:hypothetical protein SGL43_02389 [Streptomyces globisporus]|uniref:Uncharacterized protein n=1 Tax=Streptomyces globisporus TaxID=1908 RepID=A0ABN8UYK6_STRGL|nr:hypothetical protein SGL43_02389 [Streptomyces globisporus]